MDERTLSLDSESAVGKYDADLDEEVDYILKCLYERHRHGSLCVRSGRSGLCILENVPLQDAR